MSDTLTKLKRTIPPRGGKKNRKGGREKSDLFALPKKGAGRAAIQPV